VQTGPAGPTIHDIAIGLLSNALFAALLAIGQALYFRLAKRNPTYRRARFIAMLSAWGLSNAAVWFWAPGPWPWFFIVSLVPVTILVFNELNQFWKIGLVGADQEVKTGIDYVAALGMCQNSLDFLGIGGAKLVEHQKDFKAAIDRCSRSDRPVRLLLSRPDAPGLEKIAKMAGRDPRAYRDTVTESLRFISRLRNEEQKNIQVRLYGEFPAFRLMLINDSICLMSYYVLGKGDGSNLPQLHVVKTANAPDVESLYYGFTAYFYKIWDNSQEWNFQDFLE
jgi:hypothetical protein